MKKKYWLGIISAVIILIVAGIVYATTQNAEENKETGETKQPVNGVVASAYSNNDNSQTGYVELSWNKVEKATGYKVAIFNGADYQAFSVGDVSTWSTKGSGIWPTQKEVSNGVYLLHENRGGTDLPVNPKPVYKNAQKYGNPKFGNYTEWDQIFFAIIPVYQDGDGPRSKEVLVTIPKSNGSASKTKK